MSSTKNEIRQPAICLRMNETETRMLGIVADRLGMCKSETIRYLVRKAYENERD